MVRNICPNCRSELEFVHYATNRQIYGEFNGVDYEETDSEGGENMEYTCPDCNEILTYTEVTKIFKGEYDIPVKKTKFEIIKENNIKKLNG